MALAWRYHAVQDLLGVCTECRVEERSHRLDYAFLRHFSHPEVRRERREKGGLTGAGSYLDRQQLLHSSDEDNCDCWAFTAMNAPSRFSRDPAEALVCPREQDPISIFD